MNISLRTICFDASKVNIGVSKSFYFAKEMAGGYGNETSESFYFAYEVDSDGHLMKLFWADAIGRRNFELYGDAVSFDATFDTNKYNMIFSPFTGVDKHDKCVTFAVCLLSHENIEDYTWAFDHFVKAMGRNPVVILTDQYPAMKVAVHNSFSDKNGLIAKTDEFERGWTKVLKEFKLDEHKWLSDMYSIRSSWIPSFFRDEPMFGLMRTTSRSESENFFFGQFHRQEDTLCEFWLCFQSAMERQRNETERLDHESKNCIPETLSTWFIEDDAATLFTRVIFYKVQEEIISSCLDMQIKRMSEEINGVTHLEIRDVKVKDKLFKVTFFTGFKKVSVSKDHAVCSCKKFVMCGIVCRHAFCGLKQIGVTKFPMSLALNRWMEIDNSGTMSNSVSVSNDYIKMQQASLKLTNIWYDFRQAVSKIGMVFEKLDFVHQTIKQLNTDLDVQGGCDVFTKRDHIAAMVGEQSSEEIFVLVPNVCKNKGNYFKRLIGAREKALNKCKKKKSAIFVV
ncbi:protein FAR1-RELATED SEQUENCE 5-like [Apium graveolens]|uniref:protein FAR1-RELATED SEQUENCE 5-like n=1 Tax=Apium graveolens TaxID=4045 RepID=UPI003D7982EB